MIRRGRSAKYTAAPGSGGSDTETLQTDVMRFMAILGLCLTAVFALVQSLPARKTDRPKEEPPAEPLQQSSESEQTQALELRAQLQRLSAQTGQARARHDQAKKSLTSTQEQLAHALDELDQARRERVHLTAELEGLRRALGQGRQALQAVQTANNLARRQEQPDEQQPPPRRDSQPVEAPGAQPEDAPRPRVAGQTRRSEPVSAAQGFTLRFASSETLDRLVGIGSVRFYGMARKRAWRLSLQRGAPGFAQDAFPAQFHEMSPATVPRPYVEAFVKSAQDLKGSAVVWGVQLPPETERQIASLTRDVQGGALVIGADGQVHLDGGHSRE
jgi:hypothetical protein